MTSFVPTFVETHKRIAEETGRRFRLRRPSRQLVPKTIERIYRAELNKIIRAIQDDINEQLIPEVAAISRESGLRGDAYRQDIDISEKLKKILTRLRDRIGAVHLAGLTERITDQFNKISIFSRRQTMRQLRTVLGIDVFMNEPQLQAMLGIFVQENAELIESMTSAQVAGVAGIVRRGVQSGTRPAQMEKEIRKRFSTTRAKAAFIARDQVNKLNSALTQMRQTNLGIKSYRWRTSRDERVRESHLEKEGRIFRWDDPPPDTGHPGQDFNCRCTAEPVIEGTPQPKENRREVIREVKRKRERLREQLKGRKSRRLIARG